MVLCLPIFVSRHFAHHFFDNLSKPKGIEAVEEHTEYKDHVCEMPWKTGRALWVVLVLPRFDKDIPPEFRTNDHSEDSKSQQENGDIDHGCQVGHMLDSSHKDEIYCRDLHQQHGHDNFWNAIPAEIGHDRQGCDSMCNLKDKIRNDKINFCIRTLRIATAAITRIGLLFTSVLQNAGTLLTKSVFPSRIPSWRSKIPYPMVMAGTMECQVVNGPLQMTPPSGSGVPVKASAAKMFNQDATKDISPTTTAWKKEHQFTSILCPKIL